MNKGNARLLACSAGAKPEDDIARARGQVPALRDVDEHLADIRDGTLPGRVTESNGSKRNRSFPCSRKEDSAVFRRLLVVKPMPTVCRYKGL